MTRKIHQIHDKMMKSILRDKDALQEFFHAFLPDSVKEVIDLSQIEHVPGSFLSPEMKETRADMIFKCPLIGMKDQEVYLCLIVTEHKSTPDQYVSIQLGGYIFDSYRKQVNDDEPLKIVLPFLYYHGKEPWTPPALPDLFSDTPKTLHKYVPEFEIIFENIQNYSDEQIRLLGSGLFTSAILAQKYSRDPEAMKERIEQIFTILESWEDRNLFQSLIVYVLTILQIKLPELNIIIEKIPKKMKTEIMSLADRLREEGKEEGQKEKDTIAARNMLKRGFSVADIADILEVSREFVEKIKMTLDNSTSDKRKSR